MLFINIRNKALCQPDFIAAGFQALQVMDGSVTLVDAHLIKTGGLKLTVNIASRVTRRLLVPTAVLWRDPM